MAEYLLQTKLLHAAVLVAEDRKPLRPARVRHVVQAKAPERVRPGAVLEARRGELAAEGSRGDVLDDCLLRPRTTNFDVGTSVAEGRDVPRPARFAQVVDADALRRAAASVPAGQVRVTTMGIDVAGVAAARVDVPDLVRARPCRRREREHGGSEGAG